MQHRAAKARFQPVYAVKKAMTMRMHYLRDDPSAMARPELVEYFSKHKSRWRGQQLVFPADHAEELILRAALGSPLAPASTSSYNSTGGGKSTRS